MFRNFYTTQMSSNARQLQTRFMKMRAGGRGFSRLMAAVTAAALIIAMTAATVVMAAVGADGLEYWPRDTYYLTSRAVIPFKADLNDVPDWVREISGDGQLKLMLSNFDGHTKDYGWTRTGRMAEIKGSLGSVTAELGSQGFCGSFMSGEEITGRYAQYWCCGIDGYETDGKSFYVSILYSEKNVISGAELSFDDDILYSYRQLYGGEYTYCGTSDMLVDDAFAADYYSAVCGGRSSIFTDYEQKNYKNPVVDGIDVHLIGAARDKAEIYIKSELPQTKSAYVEFFDLTDGVGLGGIDTKNLDFEDHILSRRFDTGGSMIEGGWVTDDLKPGHIYAVNVVLRGEYGDYLYRWRDYMTIE